MQILRAAREDDVLDFKVVLKTAYFNYAWHTHQYRQYDSIRTTHTRQRSNAGAHPAPRRRSFFGESEVVRSGRR